MNKPKILVHACCAPDLLYVADLLKKEYEVTAFFYNPNIQPAAEYALRRDEAVKAAEDLGIAFIEGPCDEERWIRLTRIFKDEPEKGRRCDVCYALRLQKTAEKAREGGFDLFTTVMSLSPWKKASVLNRIGKLFAARYRTGFLEADFKKKDGFRKSVAMSRNLGLYRQEYCGCLDGLRVRETLDSGAGRKEKD